MITTYNSTNGMICPNCKCEIPESSKFCNQCGCKIVSTRQNSRCDLRPYIENGKFGAKGYHQAGKILSTASMVLSISSKTVIAGAQMEKRMLCLTQKEN